MQNSELGVIVQGMGEQLHLDEHARQEFLHAATIVQELPNILSYGRDTVPSVLRKIIHMQTMEDWDLKLVLEAYRTVPFYNPQRPEVYVKEDAVMLSYLKPHTIVFGLFDMRSESFAALQVNAHGTAVRIVLQERRKTLEETVTRMNEMGVWKLRYEKAAGAKPEGMVDVFGSQQEVAYGKHDYVQLHAYDPKLQFKDPRHFDVWIASIG